MVVVVIAALAATLAYTTPGKALLARFGLVIVCDSDSNC